MRLMPRWCVRNQLLTAYLLWLPAVCLLIGLDEYRNPHPIVNFFWGLELVGIFFGTALLGIMAEKRTHRMHDERVKRQREFTEFCDRKSEESLLRMKERDTLWRAKFRHYVKEQAKKHGFEWKDEP